jgi:signal peptidase
MKLRPRHRKTILDISIVVICILSVAVIYLGLRFALATPTPWVAIASGSMSPSLEVGDLVIIQGVPASEIQVGDIIVYDSPLFTYPVVHRVIRIQNETQDKISFITKGDANAGEDAPVSEDSVHGRVIYRIPILGYLALDPSIPVIIIVAILIVILVWPEKSKKRFPIRKKH